MLHKKVFLKGMVCLMSLLTTLAWAETTTTTPPTSAPTNTMPTVAAPLTPAVTSATPTNASTAPTPNQPATVIPPAPPIDAKGYILVDANSGYIIAQQNANERLAPASLTKLMTMYVVSGILRNGQLRLNDNVTISETAWRTGGSRMFVQVGSQVPVADLINGIVVASGNDACVALAEHVAGSEQAFVGLMNKAAAQLGMKNTHYDDATGLPSPDNYSTPYDLALLTRAIIHNYPEDYRYYGQKWIVYNGIKQPNRNRLLWRDATVDGLKTGHTDDAGYCLVASSERNGMRLIAIVMGAPSDKSRADDTQTLLNYGFRFFQTHKLYAANVALSQQRVWLGENKQVSLGLAEDLYVTIPSGQYNKLQANLTIKNTRIVAPVKKGQSYGAVTVTLDGQTIASQPLVALADNPKGGWWHRIIDHILLLLNEWFNLA